MYTKKPKSQHFGIILTFWWIS